MWATQYPAAMERKYSFKDGSPAANSCATTRDRANLCHTFRESQQTDWIFLEMENGLPITMPQMARCGALKWTVLRNYNWFFPQCRPIWRDGPRTTSRLHSWVIHLGNPGT